MSNLYLPEGRLLHTDENQRAAATLPALRRALEQETVLEGRAVLCTPQHDLLVNLGPFTGRIPREEAALGIREGTTREIAILSRVGKPIAVTVTGLDQGADAPLLLSRRRAQELALEALLACPPGTVLPATVTHLEGFGAFVDLGCGVVSMIGIENCSVSRLSHAGERFTLGQEIFVVLTGADRAQGRLFLSHKELLGTWLENAARFAPGMTVAGWVRGLKPYGTFVELAPNLAGLAEVADNVHNGQQASVYIKSLLPEKMKVKLIIINAFDASYDLRPFHYFHSGRHMDRWRYSPAGAEKVIETLFEVEEL